MKTLWLLFALAMTVMPMIAQTTPAELNQAKTQHSTADFELNAAYKAALAKLDEKAQAALRKEQREWLEYRDRIAKAQPPIFGDDPEKPEKSAGYWDRMAALSQERAAWLGSFYKDLPKELTGEWSDSHGGHIFLQERKDGVAFSISTARGPAPNIGEISDLAVKTKNGARYVEKDVPKDEARAACKLTFTLDAAGVLTVKSENADSFHGHGAYFDGTYRKVGNLKVDVDLSD